MSRVRWQRLCLRLAVSFAVLLMLGAVPAAAQALGCYGVNNIWICV